jgi:superfamily I DNA/RNA helicase
MTSAIQWTQDQKKAITATGRQLLVSASAGTGKTAVLAHRCLERISDPARPVDVDRLLVLTYTDAAAEEMRDRIARTLRTAYQKTHSEHLHRQALLLDAAWISTFHAFCKRILTEHLKNSAPIRLRCRRTFWRNSVGRSCSASTPVDKSLTTPACSISASPAADGLRKNWALITNCSTPLNTPRKRQSGPM